MSKEDEDYQDALDTIKNIYAVTKALDWKNKDIDEAYNGIRNLMELANTQANVGMPSTDWTLNAIIGNTFYDPQGTKSHQDIIKGIKKAIKYLKNQLEFDNEH